MKIVHVCASKTYDVVIGYDVLSQLHKHVENIKHACKIAIISDNNVAPLYLNKIVACLASAGYTCCNFIFPSGENSKTGNNYLEILDFLSQNKLTRSDLIIALGGGVVGDVAGFTAATYLRGIDYIQIPTTLLAMVDSSVGGKVAINLPSGKNQAGAFWQPSLVLCDIDTLSTLPKSTFIDGCAEVIKYGILFDPALLQHLEEYGIDFEREYVISRCIELKRNVVLDDEFDNGNRKLLNLGHSIGHAIEAHSNFSIPHGKAVAIGISIISGISANKGWLPVTVNQHIIKLLKKFQLPTGIPYGVGDILPYMLSDKKISNGHIDLVIPHNLGRSVILPTPISQLESLIKSGL